MAKVSFGRARLSRYVLWHRLILSAMVRMVSTRADFTDGVERCEDDRAALQRAQQAAPLRPRDRGGIRAMFYGGGAAEDRIPAAKAELILQLFRHG